MIDWPFKMNQDKAQRIQGQRDIAAHRDQRKARVSVAQKPSPPKEENPRVKCRDCGAFGHTWWSKTCPIKFGCRLLEPQPLGGSRIGKENQDPGRTLNLQTTPVTERQPERDKKLKQHPVF
ncbi:hypothetical protein HispidOSU_013256 [Sigmodon hispidus]